MSKEELQVNFRMPASLKRDLEQAAKANGRSLTSEVVLRLEVSVLLDTPTPDRFLPAHRALSIADYTRRDVSSSVIDSVRRAISVSANSGQTEAFVNLEDYELADLPPERIAFMGPMVKALEEQGYSVKLNGLSSITIDFSRPSF